MKTRVTAMSFVLLISSLSLSAQSSGATPVPSQFATAQTVFLASASAPGSGAHEPVIAQMVYSSLYKSLPTVGKYHLVGTPADAELSMVVSTRSHISSVSSGSSIDSFFLRLEIYDTKTHSLLWALDEPINSAFREKTFQKNVDEAVASVINDLKSLANGAVPGDPSAPTKTRLSDEKK